MSKRTFIWSEDKDGATGWIMKGMPHFDAAFGDTVAHDCMEHLPGGMKHGAIADEMLALGARLHLRVQSHWWYSQKNFPVQPAETWANEVSRQLEYIVHERTPEPPAPRSRPHPDRMDEEMEFIIEQAVKKGFAEFNDSGWDAGQLDPNGELARNMGDWMRIGVLAAEKRWNNPAGGVWDAMALQEDLARQVEKLSRWREIDEELIVEINERRMRVECRVRELAEVYPEDIYA